MGARGPAPKPNVVKLLEGNPGKRPINLADGVNPDVQIPDLVRWMNKDARDEWSRVTVELEKLGLIAAIDRATLVDYCQTWGNLCQLEKAFAAQQRTALKQGKEQGVETDIAMVGPYFARTPTGFMRESTLFRQILHLREVVNKLQREFGMSPSARMRVQASDAQMSLPGLDEKPTSGSVVRLRDFA